MWQAEQWWRKNKSDIRRILPALDESTRDFTDWKVKYKLNFNLYLSLIETQVFDFLYQ